MEIKMPNGNVVVVDNTTFEAIENIILSSDLKGKWITYKDIFPTLKPAVIEAVDAGVWNFGAVLQEMVNQGTIETRTEQEELEYFIK